MRRTAPPSGQSSARASILSASYSARMRKVADKIVDKLRFHHSFGARHVAPAR